MKKLFICFCILLTFPLSGCTSKEIQPSDETKEIIETAIKGYIEIFEIYYLANISENEDAIFYDHDNYQYFVVVSDKYKSIDDLKRKTAQVCTSTYSQRFYTSLLPERERPLYRDINGKLCRAVGDITSSGYPDIKTYQIIYETDNQLLFCVLPVQPMGNDSKIYFTVLKQFEGWRIDNVYCI